MFLVGLILFSAKPALAEEIIREWGENPTIIMWVVMLCGCIFASYVFIGEFHLREGRYPMLLLWLGWLYVPLAVVFFILALSEMWKRGRRPVFWKTLMIKLENNNEK